MKKLLENHLSHKQYDEELFGYTTATLRQQHTGSRVMWVYTHLDSTIPMICIRTDDSDTGTGMLKHSISISISQEPTYLQKTDSNGKSLDLISKEKAIDFIRNNLDLLLAFWEQNEIDEDDLKNRLILTTQSN